MLRSDKHLRLEKEKEKRKEKPLKLTTTNWKGVCIINYDYLQKLIMKKEQ